MLQRSVFRAPQRAPIFRYRGLSAASSPVFTAQRAPRAFFDAATHHRHAYAAPRTGDFI
jgi:hypothetical protein